MTITEVDPPAHLPLLELEGVTAGLDWAHEDHAVAIVDSIGRAVQRFTIVHTEAGLRELVRRLHKAGVRLRVHLLAFFPGPVRLSTSSTAR